MNNTFSMHRVALYARKHYAENSLYYLCGLLILAAMSALTLYWHPNTFCDQLTLLLLAGSGYFTIIGCHSHYSRRSMERSYTLPASPLEKYLFTWFNTTVLATIVTFVVVWGMCVLFTVIHERPVGVDFSRIEFSQIMTGAAIYLLFQAGTLLSCCWNKGFPLKVFLVIIGVVIACVLLIVFLLQPASDANFAINPFDASCSIRSETACIRYRLVNGISTGTTTTLIFGFWTLAMWIIAFFKFNERTVK